jgi:predicted TIM-barrel fold metal-dependent hydrolase
MLRDSLGLDRLLFGSDWPNTAFESVASYAGQKAFFERMVADAEERKVIFDRNPAKLFRFA